MPHKAADTFEGGQTQEFHRGQRGPRMMELVSSLQLELRENTHL